ncbi:MAG: trypsin [Actinomycetota bacterium]|jgi:trypsin|nr:trypsin [Actinomycetota bacterium]
MRLRPALLLAACGLAGLSVAAAHVLAWPAAVQSPTPSASAPLFVTAVINRSAPDGDYFSAQFCTGVLVAPRVVLTAFHCLAGRLPHQVDVVVGVRDLCRSRDRSVAPERRHVRAVAAPAGSHAGLARDLLRLELSGPDVRVAPANTAPLGRSKLTAYGWGRHGYGGVAPCQLHAIALRVHAASNCAAMAADVGLAFSETEQFCAAPADGEATNTCSGDSGGPVLDASDTVVGIVSYGRGCDSHDVGVYARSTPFN